MCEDCTVVRSSEEQNPALRACYIIIIIIQFIGSSGRFKLHHNRGGGRSPAAVVVVIIIMDLLSRTPNKTAVHIPTYDD